MESADLHPHPKVQDQYVKYSSMATQTSHHGQVSTTDEWNPSLFQNVGSNKYNRNLSETIPTSRDIPSSMANHDSFNHQSANEFLLANIKDEMSGCFPKLSELMYCHSGAEHGATGGNLQWHNNFSMAPNDHMTDLQLSSSGDLYTNSHHPASLGTTAAPTSRYDFNHIFPSAHISTSDLYSTLFSSSLDLNLKALDLLTSTYATGGSCNQSLLDSAAGKLSRNVPMDHDHLRERSDSPSTSSKISAFVSGSITSTKRPAGSFSETKESRPEPKKYRSSSVSRSPCPTLKVRKEKLGDRVAALQKLVAPFGKTDTASVLTEAIGYIQFLHDQVQTLSVPFMKSSQSRLYRTVQAGSKEEEGREEQKPDLRSRGLCLVPQSYASYFINSCSSGI